MGVVGLAGGPQDPLHDGLGADAALLQRVLGRGTEGSGSEARQGACQSVRRGPSGLPPHLTHPPPAKKRPLARAVKGSRPSTFLPGHVSEPRPFGLDRVSNTQPPPRHTRRSSARTWLVCTEPGPIQWNQDTPPGQPRLGLFRCGFFSPGEKLEEAACQAPAELLRKAGGLQRCKTEMCCPRQTVPPQPRQQAQGSRLLLLGLGPSLALPHPDSRTPNQPGSSRADVPGREDRHRGPSRAEAACLL